MLRVQEVEGYRSLLSEVCASQSPTQCMPRRLHSLAMTMPLTVDKINSNADFGDIYSNPGVSVCEMRLVTSPVRLRSRASPGMFAPCLCATRWFCWPRERLTVRRHRPRVFMPTVRVLNTMCDLVLSPHCDGSDCDASIPLSPVHTHYEASRGHLLPPCPSLDGG